MIREYMRFPLRGVLEVVVGMVIVQSGELTKVRAQKSLRAE